MTNVVLTTTIQTRDESVISNLPATVTIYRDGVAKFIIEASIVFEAGADGKRYPVVVFKERNP